MSVHNYALGFFEKYKYFPAAGGGGGGGGVIYG